MRQLTAGARRRLATGSSLGAAVVLLAALLVMLNYLGGRYYQRFDWTSERLYTLSERTAGVLAELDRDVDLIVFLDPASDLFEPTRELARRYDAASPRIRSRVLDPVRNLAEARRLVEEFDIQRDRVVVFVSGEDRRVVDQADLAELDYTGLQMGRPPEVRAFRGEAAFTGALVELMDERKPRILFTTGHGEAALDELGSRGLSEALELLGRDNYEIEEWASLGAGEVPVGADLVIVAGPTSSFVEPELDAFSRYLAGGGRMLLLLDPTPRGGGLAELGLTAWLADYGVRLGRDIVVDPASALPFFGAETIFVGDYGSHAITRSLDQAGVPVILSLARSVGAIPERAGVTVTELLRTSAEGWGERDLARLDRIERGPDDLPGPVSLGVAVEAAPAGQRADDTVDDGPAPEDVPPWRLVVLGDSELATNAQIANAGNATFFVNGVNWLLDRERLLGIPPKEPELVRLNLTRGELVTIYWLVLALLPGLAVATGLVVWWRRRR